MDGSIARLPKTNQDMERSLLEGLRLRQEEWIRASEANRELACYQFMNALDAFISLMLCELEWPHVPKL